MEENKSPNQNKAKLIVALLLSLVILAGGAPFIIPKYLINDGLARYTGDEYRAALQAKQMAFSCYDHPFSSIFRRKVKVLDVQQLPPEKVCRTGDDLPFFIILRNYTFFGIPGMYMTASCGSLVCNAQPPFEYKGD